MNPVKPFVAGRGFLMRLWNAITPTRVYVARRIVPPYVPSGVERETSGCSTVSNAIVGSGSFSLSHCRMVTADEVAMRRARVLGHV